MVLINKKESFLNEVLQYPEHIESFYKIRNLFNMVNYKKKYTLSMNEPIYKYKAKS